MGNSPQLTHGQHTDPATDLEFQEELGRGGLGCVFRAWHRSLQRTVAVKTLAPEWANDPAAVARFHREMVALACCTHPNIVRMVDCGTLPDGRDYFAMEDVQGCTLEDVFQRLQWARLHGDTELLTADTWDRAVLEAMESPPLSPSPQAPPRNRRVLRVTPSYVHRVVSLIRDAALALAEVHRHGIAHRDIKPGNLMLSVAENRVVLMDFSFARGSILGSPQHRCFDPGGTLLYMSPEQLVPSRSAENGEAADVRALGITLWELLTRHRAFGDTRDTKSLRKRIAKEDLPHLRQIDGAFDADLEALVAHATDRQVWTRLASADHFAQCLTRFLEGQPLRCHPAQASRGFLARLARRRPLFVASTLTSLSLILTASMVVTSWRKPALPPLPSVPQVRLPWANLQRGLDYLEHDNPSAALDCFAGNCEVPPATRPK